MTYPKITIVTPNFNQAGYIEETILSVLEQGYPNLEYIIMDGGSTDGSVEIIKKYSSQLSYWESGKDGGMYDALNRGFARSTGEIMGWINSDDYLHKKSLFLIAELFQDLPGVSWVQGLPNVSNEKGAVVLCREYRQYSKLDFVYDMNGGDWIQQESTFWRRSLYEKAGSRISTDHRYAGDLELWMRFFRYGKLYALNALLGSFRQTRQNASVLNRDAYHDEAKTIISAAELTEQEYSVIRRMRNEGMLNKLKNIMHRAERTHMFGHPEPLRYNFSKGKFEIGG